MPTSAAVKPDATLTSSGSQTHLPYLTASPRSLDDAGVLRPENTVTATSKPYPYTRLQDNQIRVLRISIDPDSNLLICNFDVRDLTASRGTYRAISYCWGDPKPRYSVLCINGDYLNLTESAAEVLKFVLLRNSEYWFWIDQICINQADLAERSAQVSIMGQVYSSTRQVIAWLGRGDRSTQRAVAFVNEMCISLDEMKRKGVQPTLGSFFNKSPRFHNIPSQIYESRKWKALTDLLSNPWFERLWVVQEVVMAPDETSSTGCREDSIILSFETCSIGFEMFATVVQRIWDDHLHTELIYGHKGKDTTDKLMQYPPGFSAVRIYLLFRMIRRENTEALSMSWALIYTKSFKATDHRDKIYAVMNFVGPGNLSLNFDYELSVEEVYITCAARLIERSDYPILLHIAGIGLRRSLSTLPSWVPDFSPSPFGVQVKSRITNKWFEASAESSTITVKPDPSSGTMRFSGIKIDEVEQLFQRPSPGDLGERVRPTETGTRWNFFAKATQKVLFPEREYYESFLKFLNHVKAFLETSDTSPILKDSTSKGTLFYALLRDYPIGEATVDSDLQEAYHAWYNAYQELAGHHNIKSFFASATRDPKVYDQIQRFEDLSGPADEPFFGTTKRRLLGSGPNGMLPGDIVCIIMGACTPFLLRPDTGCMGDQRGVKWKLVGPCFVYGLMYGEGLSMGEPEELIVT